MPWSLSNLPEGAKKYSKRCKQAFVRVANKELANGADEGTAIKTGYVAANNCKEAGH